MINHTFSKRQRQTGARRLRRHAQFIAALSHPRKLHMSTFTKEDEEGHLPSLKHCGTAACLVGWLPVSERRDWTFDADDNPIIRNQALRGDGWFGARHWFSLVVDEAEGLFAGSVPHRTRALASAAMIAQAEKMEGEE